MRTSIPRFLAPSGTTTTGPLLLSIPAPAGPPTLAYLDAVADLTQAARRVALEAAPNALAEIPDDSDTSPKSRCKRGAPKGAANGNALPAGLPDASRTLRQLGYTQDDVAAILGVSQASVSYWDRGRRADG